MVARLRIVKQRPANVCAVEGQWKRVGDVLAARVRGLDLVLWTWLADFDRDSRGSALRWWVTYAPLWARPSLAWSPFRVHYGPAAASCLQHFI
jgi:hypothetical protein